MKASAIGARVRRSAIWGLGAPAAAFKASVQGVLSIRRSLWRAAAASTSLLFATAAAAGNTLALPFSPSKAPPSPAAGNPLAAAPAGRGFFLRPPAGARKATEGAGAAQVAPEGMATDRKAPGAEEGPATPAMEGEKRDSGPSDGEQPEGGAAGESVCRDADAADPEKQAGGAEVEEGEGEGKEEEAEEEPLWKSSGVFSETSTFQLADGCLLVLHRGDITKWAVDQETDAIVNAANERMLGGGGVDGAIHRAAGPELLELCRAVKEVRAGVRCPTGSAVTTGAGALPVKHVIHTVGPVYEAEDDPAALLASAYLRSAQEARANGIRYMAFPAISCGIYGYPFDEAASVALKTLQEAAEGIKEVHFVLFGKKEMAAWMEAAEALLADSTDA